MLCRFYLVFFFFLVHRQPPHSTLTHPLFPYTTLSRSHAHPTLLTRGPPPGRSKPRRRNQPPPPLLSPPPPRCAPARARTSTKARSPKAMPPSRAHRNR